MDESLEKTQLIWNIDGKLARLQSSVSRWGWRGLWALAITAVKRYLGLYIFWVGVRPFIEDKECLPPAGFTLRQLAPEELLYWTHDPELVMSEAFVLDALARSHIAFGVFDGERLVSYTWRSFQAADSFQVAPHEGNLWVKVRYPYSYSYKAFTRAAYRGKHLFPAASLFSDHSVMRLGYRSVIAMVDISNLASLAASKTLGRRRAGYAGYLHWFGRYIPFCTPGLRKIGFELFIHRD